MGLLQVEAVAADEGEEPEQRRDERLVAQVLAGDEGAFEALYERYFRRITRFVLRRLDAVSDVEDVVQEVFLAVFLSAHSFRGESGLDGWIFGAALHPAPALGAQALRAAPPPRASRARASLRPSLARGARGGSLLPPGLREPGPPGPGRRRVGAPPGLPPGRGLHRRSGAPAQRLAGGPQVPPLPRAAPPLRLHQCADGRRRSGLASGYAPPGQCERGEARAQQRARRRLGDDGDPAAGRASGPDALADDRPARVGDAGGPG
jgi:hypothetical protein